MTIYSWSDRMNVKNSDLGARIKQARKTLGLTQQEFAQRLEVTQPTVHRWEKGFYEPDEEVLRRLADMTQLSPAYLRYGENGALGDWPSSVPLVGYISAGAEIQMMDDRSSVASMVEGPPRDRLTIAALQVRGDALYPVYQDGDMVFYSAHTGLDDNEFLGRECVVKIADGATVLRRVVRGAQRGKYTLIAFNAPAMADQKLDWAKPVRWIRRS
jgi:DNA-binding XRE family transcriptional regulator